MNAYLLSRQNIEALFPFFVVIDDQWKIVDHGRSLGKLCPRIVAGAALTDFFSLNVGLRKSFTPASFGPAEKLQGELVHLVLIERNTQLKGQVSVLSADNGEKRFLFSLAPVVTDLREIGGFGLVFEDFSAADPVFDFLMTVMSERSSNQKLESARQKLIRENQISNLLYRLTLALSGLGELSEVFEELMSQVCEELHWDVGHAYLPSKSDPDLLEPFKIWYFSDPARFQTFREVTEKTLLKRGIGLPGRVWESHKICWIQDVAKDANFPRNKVAADLKVHGAVGVPVIVGGNVIGVLEFFSENIRQPEDSVMRFFEILGSIIRVVFERQQSLFREKDQHDRLTAAARLSSVGEMAASVAHEINNPLTVIQGHATLLMDLVEEGRLEKESVERSTKKILDTTERIVRIVKSMRTISRGGDHEPFARISLQTLVSETVDFCRLRFKKGMLDLRIGEVDPGINVLGRGIQISQVIVNLLNNAYDAVQGAPGAWVSLTVQASGDWIEIFVADSGKGIPPEVADKLMQPFFTTKPSGKGTGLGLSISSRIVASHQGQFFLDRTAPNTRFVVKLPKPAPELTE